MDRQPLPGACVSHTQQASNEEQGLYPRLSVSFFQVRRMEDLGDRRKVESLRAKCETVGLSLNWLFTPYFDCRQVTDRARILGIRIKDWQTSKKTKWMY